MTNSGDRRKLDHFFMAEVEVPVDLGWGIAVLHADHTVTRTCKGCGVSARTAVDERGAVAPAPIQHADRCPVFERLGNNPSLS